MNNDMNGSQQLNYAGMIRQIIHRSILILFFCNPFSAFSQSELVTDSARVLVMNGSYEAAITLLEAGVKLHPNDPPLFRMLGQAYYGAKKFNKAVDAYINAANAESCSTCYADVELAGTISLEAQQLSDGRKFLDIAYARKSKTAGAKLAKSFFNEGEALLAKYDFDNALTAYRNGLTYKKDTLLYQRQLYCLFTRNDTSELLKLCGDLIPQYPAFFAPHVFIAAVNLKAGNDAVQKEAYAKATAFFTTSLNHSSQSAKAYYGLGSCYDRMGDTLLAIQHYNRAIELGITESSVFHNLGKLYFTLGRFTEAESTLQRGLRLDVYNLDSWTLLKEVYAKMGKSDQAKECLIIEENYPTTPVRDIYDKQDHTAFWKELNKISWLFRDQHGSHSLPFQMGVTEGTTDANSSTNDPADFVPVEKPPVPIKQVPPEYPDVARRANVQGTVWVKLLVGKDGKVRKARIIQTDAEIFNQVAIMAALQWEFSPAEMKGGPVEVWAAIPFRFKLNK